MIKKYKLEIGIVIVFSIIAILILWNISNIEPVKHKPFVIHFIETNKE